jgi:hypothetical protein
MSNPFDSIGTSISNAARSIGSNPVAAFGALGGAAMAGKALGGALSNLSNPANLLSKLRSINLPMGGNPLGRVLLAAATFAGADLNGDWRVRLSVPGGTIFDSSPLLAPIHAAGGLVFPYTPSINISASAKYEQISPVHNNYAFQAYQSSQPDSITITAPYYCEDSIQAAYWLATVHFLRSATKMFTGDSEPAGNPPVILMLNGYGDYVFKNVPVVITSFSVNLDANSDYISATAGQVGPEAASGGGTSLSGIAGTANAIAGLTAGLPGVSNLASKVGKVAGAASAVSNYINNLSMALTSGVSHVPTKSSFTITLQPAYSRESVKTFNLQKFVNGDYMTSSGSGYI